MEREVGQKRESYAIFLRTRLRHDRRNGKKRDSFGLDFDMTNELDATSLVMHGDPN